MERNVKIALGCGGAGCLGLIVLMVAGVVVYFMTQRSSGSSTNRNSNFNFNSNRNSRSDSNRNTNDSSGSNENDSTTTSSSMSEDDRHKLFHAASMSRDPELIRRVGRKIGILKDDFSPSDNNVEFATEHVGWVFRNADFIQSMDTPAKGKAYVEQHIND